MELVFVRQNLSKNKSSKRTKSFDFLIQIYLKFLRDFRWIWTNLFVRRLFSHEGFKFSRSTSFRDEGMRVFTVHNFESAKDSFSITLLTDFMEILTDFCRGYELFQPYSWEVSGVRTASSGGWTRSSFWWMGILGTPNTFRLFGSDWRWFRRFPRQNFSSSRLEKKR